MKQTVTIATPDQLRPLMLAVYTAAHGIVNAGKAVCLTLSHPKRTSAQNAALHAALTDISKQVTWHGQKFSPIVWKRLCMASWLREKKEQPMLIPALDGNGFDVIFEKTSELDVERCSELLEWCYAFGAENDVKFSAGNMVAMSCR